MAAQTNNFKPKNRGSYYVEIMDTISSIASHINYIQLRRSIDMVEIIIISLGISALVILDDFVFNGTLKRTSPATSQQLYLDCEVGE